MEEEQKTEEKPTEPEKKKERKLTWALGQVATEHAAVIVNTKTDEQYDSMSALVKILNDIEELKKLL